MNATQDVGGFAEEGARLLETLTELLGRHTSSDVPCANGAHGVRGASDNQGAPDTSRTDGTDGVDGARSAVGATTEVRPECRLCPICRFLGGVRQLRPEVMAHLVLAGEELLAAAREFSASQPTSGPAVPGGPEQSHPSGTAPATAEMTRRSRAPLRVQRIEIDE